MEEQGKEGARKGRPNQINRGNGSSERGNSLVLTARRSQHLYGGDQDMIRLLWWHEAVNPQLQEELFEA